MTAFSRLFMALFLSALPAFLPAAVNYSAWKYCPADPPTIMNGRATYYTLTGLFNCSYPQGSFGDHYAAMNEEDYNVSGGCGACIEATYGANTTQVRIVDRCPIAGNPLCSPPGNHHLDLSPAAFQDLAPLSAGNIAITWKFIECPLTLQNFSNLSYAFKEGSTEFWAMIQFRDHKFPIVKVEVQVGAAWVNLTREMYNYWGPNGAWGTGSHSFRITDARGNVITTAPIAGFTPQESAVYAGTPYGVTTVQFPGCVVGPLPSPTRTPTRTATATVSRTRTLTLSFTRSPTPPPSATHSPTRTQTATRTATGSATASPSRTASATPPLSATDSPTRSVTQTRTASPTPSATRTPPFTPTSSPTRTETRTSTSSPTPTVSRTDSPTRTETRTGSPTRTSTVSATLTSTRTETRTSTSTATPSVSRTPSPTRTDSPSPTESRTYTQGATPTPSRTATVTRTLTSSPSPSRTATETRTSSPTRTESPSPSETRTFTDGPSPSFTRTDTATRTASPSPSATRSATQTRTDSPSPTVSRTLTRSLTVSATFTESPPYSLTRTPTFTRTGTAAPTGTRSESPTRSATFTRTETRTPTESRTPTPTRSPTITRTDSRTPSSTRSPSHTITPAFTATESPTRTRSATASPSPSLSPSPAPAPTLLGLDIVEGPIGGGTLVTISGANFAPGATATLNGIPLTGLTWVDANTLQGSTPPGALGPAGLQVRNPDLQSASLPNAFTYKAATPTAVPGGPNEIESSLPWPNPNPLALKVKMLGASDRVVISVFTNGYTEILSKEVPGLSGPGWVTLNFGAEMGSAGSGTYFYVVKSIKDGSEGRKVVKGKFVVLR